MRLIDQGLVYDASGRPEAERTASLADLCVTASGTVFSLFQIGPIKNSPTSTLRLHRSRDQGHTWQRVNGAFPTTFAGIPGSFSVGEMAEVRPGRLLLVATWLDRSDPARPLFDPVSEGILPTKILRAFSSDEGESWTPWERVELPGLRDCAHGSGPLVQWADGAIALPFESHKSCEDPDPTRRDVQASWLAVSRDGGQTFEAPVRIAQHPQHTMYYWDQRVCAGRGLGDYLVLFWTHDRALGKDVAVHFKRGSVADPAGGTEAIQDTGIPGQISAPLLLPDGSLGALVVDRVRPGKIALWQSRDEGKFWTELPPVYRHQGSAASAYSAESVEYAEVWETLEKWRFGHPAWRLLDERTVLVTYYAGTQAGLSIHWARLELAPADGAAG